MSGDSEIGVFLDRGSLGDADVDASALLATLPDWRIYASTTAREIKDRIRDAHVLVSNKVVLSADALQSARNLRLICVAATGTNNIDLPVAAQQEIMVCNVPNYATASVTQHVFALILALATRLIDYQGAVKAGRWQKSAQFCLLDYPITELAGKVMGIVGYGELGRSVARVAGCFGMHVKISGRPGVIAEGRLPLHELLSVADIVSIHCPLTRQTRNLIGTREFGLMKRSALLINTARGGIVDEQALADALRAGEIAGAGVDVLSLEPPSEGSPLLAEDISHLIVTPHIAWASREARQRLLDGVCDNIRGFLAGKPRNVVAGEV
jgi:glycerate dehydrogenase